MTGTIYEALGARAVVNARGIYTDLGGAIVSPTVWAAMTEANEHAVEMTQLLEAAGRRIAGIVGVEAAWVTPGASAAIALGTAACMCGSDTGAMERLPDTRGLRDRVVVQQGHRTRYARMCWMTGARLVEIDGGELPAALDPDRVACIFFPGHLDGCPGTRRFGEVARLARARGIPTLVDAAFLNYPPATMRRFCDLGADLVCFSAKYFYGPSGGGFVCGRPDLVEAVAGVDFTGFESAEYLAFGRPFKLDRHTVLGTVFALDEWYGMDHAARFASYAEAVDVIGRAVPTGVHAEPMLFTMEETLEAGPPVNCLVVHPSDPRRTYRELEAGEPPIACHLDGERLVIAVDAMAPGGEVVVAERLGTVLRHESAGWGAETTSPERN
jgi:L-seryl-tRNA(Ser) seleniumtransferase